MLNPEQIRAVLQSASRTLEIEIEALSELREGLNGDFCNVIDAIFHSEGRVVVTGVGKSAIVAQKIVATLNSTGTPALFMHAADAIHGDLGMIQPNDIVLCLSKSGDTAEVKVLVPFVRNAGNVLVGIVGNPDSWLARNASFTLLTPVPKEADPNNLAPTASTAAQMALGDAIAVSLLTLRGFTIHDFAQFHPGGMLGKQLYLKVGDLLANNERPIVKLDTPISKAILEMTSKRLGCTAVVNGAEELEGIITDGDLRRMLERTKGDFSSLTAEDVMSRQPKTISTESLAAEALAIMRRYSITQLIAVDSGKYKGIVHLHDLIREGLL